MHDVHNVAIYRHGDKISVSLHLKMDPDVPLADAHEAAEHVEDVLRAEPEVEDVHTHLEPISGHSSPALGRGHRTGSSVTGHWAGAEAHGTSAARAPSASHRHGLGRVRCSVAAGHGSRLPEAHELASRLEDDIREAQPHIADVVVHTES